MGFGVNDRQEVCSSTVPLFLSLTTKQRGLCSSSPRNGDAQGPFHGMYQQSRHVPLDIATLPSCSRLPTTGHSISSLPHATVHPLGPSSGHDVGQLSTCACANPFRPIALSLGCTRHTVFAGCLNRVRGLDTVRGALCGQHISSRLQMPLPHTTYRSRHVSLAPDIALFSIPMNHKNLLH